MTGQPPKPTELVAGIEPRQVVGVFHRHAAVGRDPFAGGIGGRWGASFPVIYLASPVDAVVVEAYRHLIEDSGVPARSVQPRSLHTVDVAVSKILDLTDPDSAAEVGLTFEHLSSAVGDYVECQRIAAAAHQLQRHGILAPSATGFGNTLALFAERLTLNELPMSREIVTWERLPRDPRALRAVPTAGTGS